MLLDPTQLRGTGALACYCKLRLMSRVRCHQYVKFRPQSKLFLDITNPKVPQIIPSRRAVRTLCTGVRLLRLISRRVAC
eukprot:3264728-Rhodomonas_salina.1